MKTFSTKSGAVAAGLVRNRWTVRLLLVLLAAAFVLALNLRGVSPADAGRGYNVPQDSGMEANLGIRFTQAAVVADGGLVELRYTVLDADKATTFQNDTHHPPVLRSGKRSANSMALYRTALMKQGHNLRPGQSYYILYLNNHGAVRSGETLQIESRGRTLANVPVR